MWVCHIECRFLHAAGHSGGPFNPHIVSFEAPGRMTWRVRHWCPCVALGVSLTPLGASLQVAGIFTPNASMADSLQKASEASGGTWIHKASQTHALQCLLSSSLMSGLRQQSHHGMHAYVAVLSWDAQMSSRYWPGI